ncbi:hypothetical protein AAE478_007272 [Parahypoxylon ruwenzoriense]
MPKPKSFTKQAKIKPKKQTSLDTVEDFQAAGVDFEDAAGKWRAGDAAKSVRFFHRAVEMYNQGLRKFPQSIDLAYNKARVQLDLATHPILIDQLQRPLEDALEEALVSHRYALQLDPNNADTLFNASQVLTAIAELKATSEDSETADTEALKVLQEAIELQRGCLSVQERKYQEFLDQEHAGKGQGEAATDQATQIPEPEDGSEPANAVEEEQWFNIVEPVTCDTLIDTVLAQLGTLTTLCSIINSSPGIGPAHVLSWVEELSTDLLQKVQTFSRHQPSRLQEIVLARGNLASATLETGYRYRRIDAETYKRERDAAFELQFDRSVESIIANARSLIAFNSALAEAENGGVQLHSTLRWNALTASIENLKSASAIQGVTQQELATTHILRGDASLYLCAMAFPPVSHQAAVNSATQNAKNAEVYYLNSSRLTRDEEEKDISLLKSAVAQYLQRYSLGQGQDDVGSILTSSPRGQQWATKQLEDMVAENLVSQALF